MVPKITATPSAAAPTSAHRPQVSRPLALCPSLCWSYVCAASEADWHMPTKQTVNRARGGWEIVTGASTGRVNI